MEIVTRTTIRPVQKTDYQPLSRFFNENNRKAVTRYFNPFPLTDRMAYEIAHLKHLDRFWMMLRDDRIVGFLMLRGWDEGRQVPSMGFMVDSSVRGLGRGRLAIEMIEFMISEARRLGCKQIRFSVYASNRPILRFGEYFGFRETERETISVLGEPDEKIVMVKDLV